LRYPSPKPAWQGGGRTPSHTLTSALYYLLLTMRPGQWVKNLFVFAPLLFSRHFLRQASEGRALLGFLLFCLASGLVYLMNDLADLEKDRAHPAKRLRPLASGMLSPTLAWGVVVALLPALFGGSYLLGRTFLAIVGLYAANNVLYSFWLKEKVIIDVMSIALGFILRVMAGGAAIGVPTSSWLLLCTALLALFLGFGKRRHELLLLEADASNHRRVLSHYGTYFLDQMIAVVTASTVLSYALYTMSGDTVARFGTNRLVYTTPFVLYGIFRYLYLIHKRDEGGSPAETVWRDTPLMVNVVLWGAASGLIIYWRP